MRKQGFILLIVLPLILLMCIVGAIFFAYQGSEIYDIQRQIASKDAFWLAEAGVSRALYELRQDFNWLGISDVDLGDEGGSYSVDRPVIVDSVTRDVVCTGYMPSGLIIGDVIRKIKVTIKSPTPANFFGNAIYGPKVDLSGNYDVVGNIIYSDYLDPNPPGGHPGSYSGGSVTQDPTVNPLPRFNFQQIKTIAVSQIRPGGYDNYFPISELSHSPNFPTTFWYDPINFIPNVVYVEGDLALNGNIGTIGGFFVVVGNVLTDPDATGNTSLNGNGMIDGCVYTTGDFNINGGAHNLNVNGGVWAGDEAKLNGNAEVSYNSVYHDAIKDLNIGYLPQISRWKETP